MLQNIKIIFRNEKICFIPDDHVLACFNLQPCLGYTGEHAPVSRDVEDVQLRGLWQLRRYPGQSVVPHAEDIQAAAASDLESKYTGMSPTMHTSLLCKSADSYWKIWFRIQDDDNGMVSCQCMWQEDLKLGTIRASSQTKQRADEPAELLPINQLRQKHMRLEYFKIWPPLRLWVQFKM